MPSNFTENYSLSQWERTDKIQMEDFNEDNAKLDAALKAETDARTALATQVAKRGNCRIEHFTYTGSGGTSTTITFSARPVFFTIFCQSSIAMGSGLGDSPLAMPILYPYGSGVHFWYPPLQVTWNGNRATISGENTPSNVCAAAGKTYHVVAFYAMDQ